MDQEALAPLHPFAQFGFVQRPTGVEQNLGRTTRHETKTMRNVVASDIPFVGSDHFLDWRARSVGGGALFSYLGALVSAIVLVDIGIFGALRNKGAWQKR